jgi:hypothetical protein
MAQQAQEFNHGYHIHLDYRPARTQHIRRRRCAAFMNMLKASLEAPEAEVVN